MIKQTIIRHVLCDKESLSQYFSADVVTLLDIKRRLFALERDKNTHIPDHHYRLLVEKSFKDLKNLADVLTIGLSELSENILDSDNGRLFVIPNAQHHWQDLITEITPLLLQSTFIWKQNRVKWNNPVDVQSFYDQCILLNFRHTALPSPDIGPLQDFCVKNKGFHDLHMHLNGATEVDVIWQDYLQFPDKIYNELTEGWKSEKVRELLEQETSLFIPLKFRNLLTGARRIRHLLYKIIVIKNPESVHGSLKNILRNLTDNSSSIPGDNSNNPFLNLIIQEKNEVSPIAVEALMYVRVMDYISDNPNNGVSELFHFYLLILGLCNRLLVQQRHQNGFEQFQKITLSGLREYTERKYEDRFHQIRGNKLGHLSLLEGRFSPKDTEEKLSTMLNSVVNAWDIMVASDSKKGIKSPDFKLVAHFIKKSEGKNPDINIRHKKLRIDLMNRAMVLSLLTRKYKKYKKLVTGIDAASSEFDAPPEVFAPSFRLLRRSFNHFTYHAGEDFHHITSGIRAIYEAIIFTDMHSGDRIGHAVAIGLSPSQWIKSMGKHLLITKGEWLDNLIFVYHLIKKDTEITSRPFHKKIVPAILKLAQEIYQENYSLDNLEQSWLYRKYEPMLVFAKDREQAQYRTVFDEEQWQEIKHLKIPDKTKEILRKYHSSKNRPYYEEIITINSNEIFTNADLLIFQRKVLKFMQARNIAIEALPTSNIRIGHYQNFKAYHLWNWLKWHAIDKEQIPPIVIGTDDTGIFATNIFNEYANIYKHLTGAGKASVSSALETIQMLEDNSKKFQF